MKGGKVGRVAPGAPETQAAPDDFEAVAPLDIPNADAPGDKPVQLGADAPLDIPDDKGPLEKAYDDASKFDPEHAAKVIGLAKQIGEPEAFVDKNLPEIQKAVAAPPSSLFDQIEKNYPGTNKFLSQPKVMAMSHDNIPNMVAQEHAVQTLNNDWSWENAGKTILSGLEGSTGGMIARAGLPDYELGKDADTSHKFVAGLAGMAGDLPVFLAGAAVGAPIGGATGVAGGFAAANIPGAAFGGIVGTAVGGSAGGFGLVGFVKQALREDFEKGKIKSWDDAQERIGHAITEGAKGMALGTAGAIGGLGAGALVSGLASNVVKAAAPMVGETAGLVAGQSATEGRAPTWDDVIDNLAPMLAMHTIPHVLGAGVRSAADIAPHVVDGWQKSKSDQVLGTFNELGDLADKDKLRARDKAAFKDFLGNVTKDTPTENTFIDHETFKEFFQSQKLDPAEVAKSLGDDALKSYQEAEQTGGHVKIPTSEFIDRFAGTPHFQELVKDVKIDPSDLSSREIETKTKEKSEQTGVEMRAIVADMQAEKTANPDAEAPAYQEGQIADIVRPQLEAAGRSKEEAEKGAQIIDSFYARQGALHGVDPLELAKRFGTKFMGFDFAESQGLKEGEAAQSQYDQSFIKPGETEQTKFPLPENVKTTAAEIHTAINNKGSNKEIEAQAKSLAKRGTYTNDQTGMDINFSSQSVKKSLNQANRVLGKDTIRAREHLETLQYIPELIKNAAFLTESAERKGGSAESWMNLFAPLKMNGQDYLVKLQVKNEGGENILHNFATVKVDSRLDSQGLPINQAMHPETHNFATTDLHGANEGQTPALDTGTAKLAEGTPIHDFISQVKATRDSHKFFQADDKGPRGKVAFSPEGKSVMTFLKGADQSTFIHEAGHIFLEVIGHLAEAENAPKELKDDYAEILKSFGVENKAGIKTEHHEQWARGFEKYIAEGNVPSEKLRGAFDKFKSWLIEIYKNLGDLKVELSPEIRGVMDRMLASKEEIEAARNKTGLGSEPMPDASPEMQGKIKDMATKAREQAEAALLKPQMKELEAKHKQFLADERERQTEKAKEQVNEEPIFKAAEEIQKDSDFLIKYKGDEGKIADAFLREKLSPELAGKIEALAEIHGFASGEELSRALMLSKEQGLYKIEVEKRVGAAMEAHADIRNTDQIKAEAIKAIHSEKMTELLALEKQALEGMIHKKEIGAEVTRRNRIEASIEAKAARDHAKTILSDKPIKDSGNPRTYITAERNAAVKVSKAIAAKDYEKAVEAKRQQMLNHALASEAIKNAEESDKHLRVLDKYAKRGNDLKDMPYGFTRVLDQMLSKFGLTEARPEDKATLSAIAQQMAEAKSEPGDIASATGLIEDASGGWKPEGLTDFVSRVNQDNYELILPDAVLNGVDKNFKELTMSELRDLTDAVKAVADVGKKWDRFLDTDRKVTIKAEAKALRIRAEETYGTPHAENLLPGSSHGSKIDEVKALPAAIAGYATQLMDNVLNTCNKIDGYERDGFGKSKQVEGPAKDNIWRPLNEAQDRKTARMTKVMKEVTDIFGKHYTEKEVGSLKDTKINVEGRHFSKEELLSMALNVGNEGNLDRLSKGFDWSLDKIHSVLETHLDKRDFDFCQDTWDHINKYKPEIVKLEMDVNGVQPKMVDAKSFTNKHGTYEGGYYPAAYDSQKSSQVMRLNQNNDPLFKQMGSAKAATEQGHAKERATNVKLPIRLSLDVLMTHHENMVHDLEFRKPIIDASRFLAQADAKTGITNAIGVKGYNGLGDWVKAVASAPAQPISPIDQVVRGFRFKTTLSIMGWKLASAPKIGIENFFNVSRETNLAKGVLLSASGASNMVKQYFGKYVGASSEMHTDVMARSEFMRQRASHLDRDMGDITDRLRNSSALDKAQHVISKYAFAVHAMTDQAFSVPLWNDSYTRALGEHGNDKLAVRQADETIKRVFMSGSVVDQAKIMRGGELQKAVTVGFGYQSMMWNRFSQDASQISSEWLKGNPGAAVAIAARSTVYTFMMPAITVALTREFLRNNQSSNEDESKKRVVGSLIEEAFPLKFIPIVRDLIPVGVKMAEGEHGAHYQASPLEGAAESLLLPAADMFHAAFSEDHNLPEKTGEHVGAALSFALGVPKSVNDAALNFMDWQQNNGEATWRDFLTRRTKK